MNALLDTFVVVESSWLKSASPGDLGSLVVFAKWVQRNLRSPSSSLHTKSVK